MENKYEFFIAGRARKKHITQNKTSIITIFLAIGTLLIALSLITLFAINWSNITPTAKIIISIIPIVITIIMLYYAMYKNDSKLKLYTSIFAPITIIASNSLILQVVATKIIMYQLIFMSVLMFLPIAFMLKNNITMIVYGVGSIIYTLSAADSDLATTIVIINTLILFIPLLLFNIVNYIKNKEDNKNIIIWILNMFLITILFGYFDLIREDMSMLYYYMLYLITQYLFKRENPINKIISNIAIVFIILSCISPNMISFAADIEFGLDTILLTIFTGIFFYLSKAYEEPKEYFICIFVFILQFLNLNEKILFLLCNIIAISYGIYKIITGNKKQMRKQNRQGIEIILLIILFRFIGSDLGFMGKSILFLLTGIGFIVSAKVVETRMGKHDKDENGYP